MRADRTARSLSVDPVGNSSGSGAGIVRFYKYRSDWKLPNVTLYVLSYVAPLYYVPLCTSLGPTRYITSLLVNSVVVSLIIYIGLLSSIMRSLWSFASN